ncbi:MAG: hypothetical protein EOP64_00195 [Sphingomonas sp.]|nr:MAG: hypothetical protein EOP64_00195 [Sphingomonas sp.]
MADTTHDFDFHGKGNFEADMRELVRAYREIVMAHKELQSCVTQALEAGEKDKAGGADVLSQRLDDLAAKLEAVTEGFVATKTKLDKLMPEGNWDEGVPQLPETPAKTDEPAPAPSDPAPNDPVPPAKPEDAEQPATPAEPEKAEDAPAADGAEGGSIT